LTSLCFTELEGWEAIKTTHLGNPHVSSRLTATKEPVEAVTNAGAITESGSTISYTVE
jgi:hypothetical protein